MIYLLWLAWEGWTEEERTLAVAGEQRQSTALAGCSGAASITNLLNPKAAVFYIAVLPEFIQPTGARLLAQSLLLGVVYVGDRSPSIALHRVGCRFDRALSGRADELQALASARLYPARGWPWSWSASAIWPSRLTTGHLSLNSSGDGRAM